MVMKYIRFTLRFIGTVQVLLGLVFMIFPNQFATLVGLELPPDWVLWMFGNMGARFLGFGYGMFLAANDPVKHRSWIVVMLFIQVIDWIFVVYHLLVHSISLSQAATAPVFPLVFVAVLGYYLLNTRTETSP
jgi:hypothetical protein